MSLIYFNLKFLSTACICTVISNLYGEWEPDSVDETEIQCYESFITFFGSRYSQFYEKSLKVKADKAVFPMPANEDMLFTHANISLARRELGYKAHYKSAIRTEEDKISCSINMWVINCN